MEYPKKYLPKKLSKRDKNKQKKALEKAREGYKNQKYIDRPKVDIKNKESPHIVKAKKIYKIDKIVPDKVLADKTGCSISGLKQIVKKGEEFESLKLENYRIEKLLAAKRGGLKTVLIPIDNKKDLVEIPDNIKNVFLELYELIEKNQVGYKS